MGLLNDACCFILAFPQSLGGFFLRQFEVTGSTAGSIQTICNLLLTFCQSLCDRRPDILHAEINEDRKGDGLTNQG